MADAHEFNLAFGLARHYHLTVPGLSKEQALARAFANKPRLQEMLRRWRDDDAHEEETAAGDAAADMDTDADTDAVPRAPISTLKCNTCKVNLRDRYCLNRLGQPTKRVGVTCQACLHKMFKSNKRTCDKYV
jgi:hypothetical protein